MTERDEQRRAIGYVRVSTDEQVESGAGLAAQRMSVQAEAARRGWRLLDVLEDAGQSGKSLDRPGLNEALLRLDEKHADLLLVAKLDRLSRSVHDFSGVMLRAQRGHWSLRVLDVDVDTSTPTGELLAHIVASTAQYERRLISQRTKDGLAAKRAQGVRLGRPSTLSSDVVERIVADRAAGASLRAIADTLNTNGVAPGQGGRKWYAATVRAVLQSQAATLPR